MKHIRKCHYCCEIILPGEKSRVTNEGRLIFHFECFMRMIVGPVSHQLQKCSCFGGDERDPPEWTRRQAAKAASDLYCKGYYESPTHQSPTIFLDLFKPSLN
jgi:hypothetical protein